MEHPKELIKAQWKATEMLLSPDEGAASVLANYEARQKNLNFEEEFELGERIEEAQNATCALLTGVGLWCLWKIGKGVYKLIKWRKRLHR